MFCDQLCDRVVALVTGHHQWVAALVVGLVDVGSGFEELTGANVIKIRKPVVKIWQIWYRIKLSLLSKNAAFKAIIQKLG